MLAKFRLQFQASFFGNVGFQWRCLCSEYVAFHCWGLFICIVRHYMLTCMVHFDVLGSFRFEHTRCIRMQAYNSFKALLRLLISTVGYFFQQRSSVHNNGVVFVPFTLSSVVFDNSCNPAASAVPPCAKWGLHLFVIVSNMHFVFIVDSGQESCPFRKRWPRFAWST